MIPLRPCTSDGFEVLFVNGRLDAFGWTLLARAHRAMDLHQLALDKEEKERRERDDSKNKHT
jgi:hypothetical protein